MESWILRVRRSPFVLVLISCMITPSFSSNATSFSDSVSSTETDLLMENAPTAAETEPTFSVFAAQTKAAPVRPCVTITQQLNEVTTVVTLDCEFSVTRITCDVTGGQPLCTTITSFKTTSTTSSTTTSVTETSTTETETETTTFTETNTSTLTTTSTFSTRTSATQTTSTRTTSTRTVLTTLRKTSTWTVTSQTKTTTDGGMGGAGASGCCPCSNSTTSSPPDFVILDFSFNMPSFGILKRQAEDAVSAATAKYLNIDEATIVMVNATAVNTTMVNTTNATSKTRRLRGRRLASIWALIVRFRVRRVTAVQACSPLLVLTAPNSSQALADFSSAVRAELINLGASPNSNFSITGLSSSSCKSFTTTAIPSGDGDQSLIQKPPEPTPPLSGPLLIVVIVVAVVVVLLVCCYCIVCRRKREPKGLDVMPDHQATADLWRLESERWSFTEEVLGNEAPDPPLPKNWSGTWTAGNSSNSSSPPRPRRYMFTFQAGGKFDGSGEDPRGRFRISGGAFDIKSRKLYWREVFGEDGIVTEGVAEFRPKGGGKFQDDDEAAENVESWEIVGTLYAFDTSLSAHRLGSGRLCLSEAGTSGPPRSIAPPPSQSDNGRRGPPPHSKNDDRPDDRQRSREPPSKRGSSRDTREDDESDRRPLREDREQGSDNERHVAFKEDDDEDSAKPRHRNKQQTVGRRSPQSSPERDDEVDQPSSRQNISGKKSQQQSRRSPQSSPERDEEEDVRQSSRHGRSDKHASRSPERSTRRGNSRQPERIPPHVESLERSKPRRGSPRDDEDEEEEQTSSRRR